MPLAFGAIEDAQLRVSAVVELPGWPGLREAEEETVGELGEWVRAQHTPRGNCKEVT